MRYCWWPYILVCVLGRGLALKMLIIDALDWS